jgi:hypothetical protein
MEDKINFLSPEEAQTGPAKRRDTTTINKHLDFILLIALKAKVCYF